MAETNIAKPVGLKENLLKPRTYLGFIIAAAVIFVFLKNFNLKAAIESIAQANYLLLIVALLAFYASLPLRGLRWRMLLGPSNIRIGWKKLTHYYFLSWFANAILPARIGDVYRAYLLKKNDNVSIPLSLGVIFTERIIDLVITAILMVLSGSYFWAVLKDAPESVYLYWGVVIVAIIVVMFMAMIFALPWVVKISPGSLKPKLEQFHSGIIKSPSLMPGIAAITVSIWLSEALRLYFVFLAFNIKAGFLMAVFISQASLILMALPLSPAGLGLVELLMLSLLSSADISTTLAGAITLTDRLISYWSLVVSGGITYLLSQRTR